MRHRIVLFALAVCLSLAAAPLAHAATYTVFGCNGPSGAEPMSGWHVSLDNPDLVPSVAWEDRCPTSVLMTMDPNQAHPNGQFARETFIAPPGTTVQAYTIWRAVRLVPSAGFYYQALADSAGEWSRIDGCTGPGQCGTYGNFTSPTAAINHWTGHPAPNTTQLELQLVCAHSTGCPKVLPNTDSVAIFRSAVALQDDSAPQFAGAPSGPLVSGGTLSGVQSVSIGASDQGGGVYQAEIEVDGHVVAHQVLDNSTGTCQTPFTAVAPCPLSASGTIGFNTAQLADGSHTLRILVTDAAGNTAAWGPVTIRTVNNPCSPVPSAAGMTLKAAIVSSVHHRTRLSDALTIGSSQHPTVQGSLLDSAGSPVGNASLCVAAQDDAAGAPVHAVATLTTNSAGRFTYRLGSGPSRTVYFIHRVAGGAIAASVHLAVHVPVRVRVNANHLRNGQVMTWKGRLPGPVPHGVLGLMQVWRGTYWETFKQIAVAHNGTWSGRYRFTFTTGVQRYVFRLLVPHQSQYPYAAGTSRKLRVVVTG